VPASHMNTRPSLGHVRSRVSSLFHVAPCTLRLWRIDSSPALAPRSAAASHIRTRPLDDHDSTRLPSRFHIAPEMPKLLVPCGSASTIPPSLAFQMRRVSSPFPVHVMTRVSSGLHSALRTTES